MKGPSNVKNEMKIMSVADNHFQLWVEFFSKHSSRDLINPDTLLPFNVAKGFKLNKMFTLSREFFKHLGHFTDEDLKTYVLHLLGRTPNWRKL